MTPNPFISCTSCGYDLAGLPQGSACPECGTPIALSLQHAAAQTWGARLRAAALAPACLRRQSAPTPRDVAHLRANSALAVAAIIFLPCGLFVLDSTTTRNDLSALATLLLILAATTMVAQLIVSTSLLALAGLFGTIRGRRPDARTRQSIAARASFNLLAAALGAPAVFVIGGGLLSIAENLGAPGRPTRLLSLALLVHAAITALYGLIQLWLHAEPTQR